MLAVHDMFDWRRLSVGPSPWFTPLVIVIIIMIIIIVKVLAPTLVHPTGLHSATGHLHILLHPEGEARGCALVRTTSSATS